MPYDIGLTIIVFAAMGLYNRVWSFASISEAMRTAVAVLAVNTIEYLVKHFLLTPMPRSYYIINAGLMLVFMVGIRVSIRVLRFYRNRIQGSGATRNFMVVGAGAAGSAIMREIANTYPDVRVACVIDDNPNKKNDVINGAKIIGGRDKIKNAVEKYDIETIIIALPGAGKTTVSELTTIANETNAKVRVLPFLAASTEGTLVKQIRDLNYEDLLGRDPVEIDSKTICKTVHNKCVMVTGAGGSIGSELCRQLIKYEPRELVMLDVYENTTYEILTELGREYKGKTKLSAQIASITNKNRMTDIFELYKPDIIYHAAAHKHVPLMEDAPCEAIENNCMGTLILAELADKYNVEKFVQISTDKAVRPTNIMGATKRICEMIIQSYAKNSKTKFSAVRFGNVLGSHGSVIPLFFKQIEKGGPLTVTHKDITRFFMSIPEAVSLVIQSGEYAKGGEIFVLDMGKPVRIYDLAEKLIRIKGLRPNKDIDIKITGLRPGEKLYEELLMDEEGLTKTDNELIFIGKPMDLDPEEFGKKLLLLISEAQKESCNIKNIMADVCDTYTPDLTRG